MTDPPLSDLKIKHRDEMMRALQPLIDDMMHRLSDKDKAVTSWKMAQGAGGGVVVGSAADPAGWVSVPHPPKH